MQNTASITKSSASDMPRKVLFIVNPNAGKKISEQIIGLIRKEFPQNMYYQIVVWKDKNHFDEITELLKTQGYTDAVAVGGDGTVNQVAKSIVNTGIALGILPVGSGNGLARTLGISMNLQEAVQQVVKGQTTSLDAGEVNGRFFFCTSGVGFDAHIGQLFATSKKRGLQSYVKITLSRLLAYRAEEYTLSINGEEIQRKAFLITVANAGQYGNDFYIAPEAKVNDGKFHVAILKPFSILSVWSILLHILRKKAHHSNYIETFVTNQLVVRRKQDGAIHYDGEPANETKELQYSLMASCLKAITGPSFQA